MLHSKRWQAVLLLCFAFAGSQIPQRDAIALRFWLSSGRDGPEMAA